jgi:Acyl-protein synthetase, LuxE
MISSGDIVNFIERPGPPEKFKDLAIEVFRYQFDNIQSYRMLCEARGLTRHNISSLNKIPYVSTVAFKYAELTNPRESSHPGALQFSTSGTTAGPSRRGRHVVPYPEVYRASAIAHLRAMLFPDRRRVRTLAMHPGADVMPESSLSTMVTWCAEEFGTGTSAFVADRLGVNYEAAAVFLRRASEDCEPVCILTTTAAFARLCQYLETNRERITLAEGSRMMDTGGAKGQVSPLTPAEVIARAGEFLEIAPDMVINEYGMTELCSQLYDATAFNSDEPRAMAERIKIAPPWMMPLALDPITMSPVADGEPGLLAFFDLANFGSVSAVATEDVGIVEGNRVRVIGRAAAAEARGCALALGEFEAVERGAAHR